MTSTRSSSKLRRTAGFSLVELLVVFAIIAILAALTATAVFKVIGVQRSSNTQLTVKGASSLLEKQWAYVVNVAKNESIPPKVADLADNDPTRARVIWIKLRLKQEFPMNVSEALYPYFIPTAGATLTASDLPGKRYFYDRITQAFPHLVNPNWPGLPATYPPTQTPPNTPPFTTDPTLWPLESAFTLTSALQVNRGSIVFNEESFAVNALSNEVFLPQSPGGQTLLYSGPRALVDSWGFPLRFYRWPVGNQDFWPSNGPSATAAAKSSQVSAAARNRQNPDPLDPLGTLIDPRWNYPQNAKVSLFEAYCHPIRAGAFYTEPVIISAGPDNDPGFAASGASPFLPDIMQFDPLAAAGSFDNVASYKLRAGGTGDK